MIKSEHDKITAAIGTRIAEIAQKCGGKRVLAKKLDIQESRLYRFINGESALPSPIALKISKIGGVSLNWLLMGDETRIPVIGTAACSVQTSGNPQDFYRSLGRSVVGAIRAQEQDLNIELSAEKFAEVFSILFDESCETSAVSEQKANQLVRLASS